MSIKTWAKAAKQWMEQKGITRTPTEVAIDELIAQQHDLTKMAIDAYAEQDYKEWRRINAESERISRQIAVIEYGHLIEDSELE